VIAMGLFGVADILVNHEKSEMPRLAAVIGRLWPSREEFRQAAPASVRGTVLGSLLGVLPGGSAALAAFSSYALEKRSPASPSASAAAPSRASPARRAPTMPAHRPRSSRC
jgi:putative tricarboxylic transport membrane protein